MTLENKLGMTSSAQLANEEELLTKRRALELYGKGLLGTFEVGTFDGLAKINGYLVQDAHDFAGEMHTVNIAKGGFRFAPSIYLPEALEAIGKMPQSTFDKIIEKYVEMNVAHPLREGNGRATRIWLGAITEEGTRSCRGLKPHRQRGLPARHGTQSHPWHRNQGGAQRSAHQQD